MGCGGASFNRPNLTKFLCRGHQGGGGHPGLNPQLLYQPFDSMAIFVPIW